MSDLFGNHIVCFLTHRLNCNNNLNQQNRMTTKIDSIIIIMTMIIMLIVLKNRLKKRRDMLLLKHFVKNQYTRKKVSFIL